MKKLNLYPFALFALNSLCAAPDAGLAPRHLMGDYSQIRTIFEKNIGQAPAPTGFIGKGLRHAVSLDATGASLRGTEGASTALLRLVLLNANPSAQAVGVDPASTKVDYLIGDPSHWLTNVPVFQKVRYEAVWPGVDIVYYGNDSHLEYDLVLAPGADLTSVCLRFDGARSVRLNAAGGLDVETSEGTLEQRRPRLYQRRDGRLVDVQGTYVIDPDSTIRFSVPRYDGRQELVIDPELVYLHLLSPGYTNAAAVTIDSSGNAYYTGQAQQQAFLVKLDPLGNQLGNITFGGSTAASVGNAIALDPSLNIGITGSTAATDFSPLNSGFQQHLAGATDAFLVEFSPSLTPIYGTYIGGSSADQGNALAFNTTGNAYVVGQTASSTFPHTGPGPAFHNNTTTMGFLVIVNTGPSGNGALNFAAYMGGSGTDLTTGVSVDTGNNVTLAGTTSSADFTPSSTSIGYSPVKNNGSNPDGFLLTVDPTYTAGYFTYWPYGPVSAMATNGSIANLTGTTNGVIAMKNPYQNGGGAGHVFAASFNTSGVPAGIYSLYYATYLAGSGSDTGLGIGLDAYSNIYLVGTTTSANFPQTPGAIPLPPGSQPPDGFFSVLNPYKGTNGLVYSTLLGGSASDSANAVAVTVFGDSYLAANSASPNFLGGNSSGVFGLRFGVNESMTPMTGSGQTQTYTFTFTDQNGYADIAGAQIVINSSLTAVNSCYLLFARPDRISLASDSGYSYTTSNLGSPSVLQNSQCVVLSSETTQSGSGTTVTLNLTVAFKTAFAGPKNVWANYNVNAGAASGWLLLGTYSATAPTKPLTVNSVAPNSGSGAAQAFTFSYFDPYGAPDISGSQIVLNSSLTGVNSCYVLFSGLNQVSLAGDSGNTFTTAVLGQPTVLQNSQCVVYAGNSYQTQLGQNLNVTLFIAFKASFAGAKNIWASANTNGNVNTGYSLLGTWTAPAFPPALSVNSVSPSSFSGPSQALTFVYEDGAGSADITSALVIINPSQQTTHSCYIAYTPSNQAVILAGDSGGITSAIIGQPTALKNSQCIVNVAASTQFTFGNYLVLTLFVTMETSGNQNVYTGLTSKSSNVPLSQMATWNVTSPPALTPVSVAPLTGGTGVGNFQYFTFTMSDPAGASDLSGALFVLNGALQGANSCYILWGGVKGVLSLASNDAKSFTSGNLGAPGLLSNSQCTVDPSRSFVTTTGDTANLTIAISFQQPYIAFTGGFYTFMNVETKAAVFSGWQVDSRFTVQ